MSEILIADIHSQQIIPPYEIYLVAKQIRLQSLSDTILEEFRLHPTNQFYNQTNPMFALEFLNNYVKYAKENSFEEKLIQQGIQGGIRVDGKMYYLTHDKNEDWYPAQVVEYNKEREAPYLVTFVGFPQDYNESIPKDRLFNSGLAKDWIKQIRRTNNTKIQEFIEKLSSM